MEERDGEREKGGDGGIEEGGGRERWNGEGEDGGEALRRYRREGGKKTKSKTEGQTSEVD